MNSFRSNNTSCCWQSQLKSIKSCNCLFIGGGGFTIMPFIGALNTIGWKHFERISGLSAGSLLAVMLCFRFTFEEILLACDELEVVIRHSFTFDRFFKLSLSDASKDIAELIAKIFDMKSVQKDITFKDIKNITSVNCTVLSYCIDTCKIIEFSDLATPDVTVVEALLSSIALPFIYPFVSINGSKYCDAGLVNSAPLGFFEPTDTVALIVRLHEEHQINTIPQTLRWRCHFLFQASLRVALMSQMKVIQITPEPGVRILSRMNTPFCVFFAKGVLCTLLYMIRNEIGGFLIVMHFFPYFTGLMQNNGQKN